LNQPLRAYLAEKHHGELGREFSLLVPSQPGVAVKAMKLAEESDEIVVRLQEIAAAPARVAFADGERIAAAREVDGAEGPLGPLSSADLARRGAGLALRAYETRALALRLGPPPVKLSAPRSTPLALPFDCDAVSRDENRRDGAFDRRGRTLPGELLPGELVVHGVLFVFGSSQPGERNALRCRGQVLALPPGKGRRLYALAAAAGRSRRLALELGADRVEWEIEDWLGFYGDAGGPRRSGDVAWVGTHHHSRWGDEAYAFCYLYQHRAEIGDGVTELRLPRLRGVRLMALTVAENPNDELRGAGVAYH
jgi:alpha-mannosidase